MALRKRKGDGTDGTAVPAEQPDTDTDTDTELDEVSAADEDGPFDVEDFDDAETAAQGRLDLGSVLIPMPENGQVQVELNPSGVPSAIWVVTPNGRFTVAAYAAPKSPGLWREVAAELADSLRADGAQVSIQSGPWGREVLGTAAGVVRFIGVDGYRWMIRCVVNGAPETVEALAAEARRALVDTVVRRGDQPMPVRTPLPVELPEPMAAQLRAAAAQAAAAQAEAAGAQGLPPEPGPEQQAPVARRSVQGSAMQQLNTITGG
ncbi:DUF3710 domain-containing protein [Mycolicibacterium fallax]|jgi:hypothetical protein|uniref:Uncharacterized protein n=1 Tax=Mycolicibacterium fallax TaxID=1793 RepID=A0A1X1RGI5_MYCFA|nr:DUF3710 domain-containing protein [Mycolicibacterium fallax]ORV05473.1 hypothetical protein AWC04_06305 [Mycolicibacterium fallax]BBY97003.1 hypothetical protein MFAL_04700 [Mycolicibacterium fallax]HOW93698.1 DUF3710 domain-containing protein [Mycolicibacterium fallax]